VTERQLPRVAIVGYPNVGKSTLFNRITETREAVVAPEAGVTRDRKEGPAEWVGRRFMTVDTGGIDLKATEPLAEQVRDQARLAIEEAAVVVFLVDGKAGVGPAEEEIAQLLRHSRVPVVLAVNKIDVSQVEAGLHEFWGLGLGEPYGVSGEHGLGIGDLLDALVVHLPERSEEEEEQESIRIAIVGRPNVGKSSIMNALLGSERVIVSPIPGTTRDAIDTPLSYDSRELILVDTAGLRRRGKRVAGEVEFYTSLRSVRAMERSNVALVVVDAQEGLVDLDLQVAYEAQRAKCATAVLFNKWDVNTVDLELAAERLAAKVQMRPPWLTVSALTGRGIERILPLTVTLYDKYSARIPTAELNRWLEQFRRLRGEPQVKGKRLKLFYIVQYDESPPRFKVMVNSKALITRSYAYHMENRLREAYGFAGIPLIIDFEGKEERF
jgi:GTPase